MQDKNNTEIGYSNAKVTQARERSPQRQTYQPQPRRDESPPRQSSFKPRGGSPLRSSYKRESYNYWSLFQWDFKTILSKIYQKGFIINKMQAFILQIKIFTK